MSSNDKHILKLLKKLHKTEEKLSKTKEKLSKTKEKLSKTKEKLSQKEEKEEELRKTKKELRKTKKELRKTKKKLCKTKEKLSNEQDKCKDLTEALSSFKKETRSKTADINKIIDERNRCQKNYQKTLENLEKTTLENNRLKGELRNLRTEHYQEFKHQYDKGEELELEDMELDLYDDDPLSKKIFNKMLNNFKKYLQWVYRYHHGNNTPLEIYHNKKKLFL